MVTAKSSLTLRRDRDGEAGEEGALRSNSKHLLSTMYLCMHIDMDIDRVSHLTPDLHCCTGSSFTGTGWEGPQVVSTVKREALYCVRRLPE